MSQAEEQAPARAAADTLVARPPLRSLVEDLLERREQAKLGGGAEKIERQHAQDKLTARERLALLIDEGSFTELGIHGRPHFSQRAMEGKEAPADGVVTGYGKIGRPPGGGRRLRLHRDGRLDGHDRRAEGQPPARARAAEAHPVDLAARLGGRAHPGGRRARCSPARATCSARRWS